MDVPARRLLQASHLFLGSLLLSAALAACSMPLRVADLGAIHVEIIGQPTVQARCAALGVGVYPIIGYPLGVFTFGCSKYDEHGAFVYSVDSTGVLLHELDHIVNKKWCHSWLGKPIHCQSGN